MIVLSERALPCCSCLIEALNPSVSPLPVPAMCMQGPLAWALLVWRCSLVFSSVDKIVSVLIHLLPGNMGSR